LECTAVRDGDGIGVGDVTGAGAQAAEGTEGLGSSTTTTTDGLGEESSGIDARRGDVSCVGDGDGATGGIADEGAAEDDGVTSGEAGDTTTTADGLGEQTDGVVAGGLDGAGVGDAHRAGVGDASAAGTHRHVACHFSCGTTTTTDGLSEKCWRAEAFADQEFSSVVNGDISAIGRCANQVHGTEVEGGADIAGAATTTTDGLNVDQWAELTGGLHRARVGERDLACVLAAGAVDAAELGSAIDLAGVSTTATDGLEADTGGGVAGGGDQ